MIWAGLLRYSLQSARMSLKVILLQLFALSSIGLGVHSQEKPNIIFIFADDLGNYLSPHPTQKFNSFITARWQRHRETNQNQSSYKVLPSSGHLLNQGQGDLLKVECRKTENKWIVLLQLMIHYLHFQQFFSRLQNSEPHCMFIGIL